MMARKINLRRLPKPGEPKPPVNGARECARRVRQAEKIAGRVKAAAAATLP